MLYRFLCLSLLAVACTAQTQCGTQSIQPASPRRGKRVVNGVEAVPHSWPWQISFDNYNSFGNCGGSLIREDVVLTAAHCVWDDKSTTLPDGSLSIRAGKHNLKVQETDEELIPVVKIVIHPLYQHKSRPNTTTRPNDFALMKLQKPVILGSTKQLICLPSATDAPATGSMCVGIGWGNTLPGNGDSPSDVLRQATVPIVDSTVCNDADHYAGVLNATMQICAGWPKDGGADTCDSDSGGPLLCKSSSGQWVAQGVLSFGMGAKCGSKDYPGVYARVASYIGWITDTMASL